MNPLCSNMNGFFLHDCTAQEEHTGTQAHTGTFRVLVLSGRLGLEVDRPSIAPPPLSQFCVARKRCRNAVEI